MTEQRLEPVAESEPPHRTPTPGAWRTGIRRFAWLAWPWMNWVLPVLHALWGFGASGYLVLAVILAPLALLAIPVLGVLSDIPRILLRQRGHDTAPGPIVWLLFLNWWGWLASAASAATTVRDPVLRDGVIADVEESVLRRDLGAIALLVIVVTGFALIALAAAVRPAPSFDPDGADPPRESRRDPWAIAALVAAIALPLSLIVILLIDGDAMAGQTDAAGDTVAYVAALPIDRQAERAEEHYASTQQRLSEVRALVADDGWRIRDRWGARISADGFAFSEICVEIETPCYTLEAGFAVDGAPVDLRSPATADALAELGWTPAPHSGEWVSADGYTLTTDQDDSGRVTLWIESPAWWGDDADLRDEIGRGDPDEGIGVAYRAEEWPPLD